MFNPFDTLIIGPHAREPVGQMYTFTRRDEFPTLLSWWLDMHMTKDRSAVISSWLLERSKEINAPVYIFVSGLGTIGGYVPND